MKQIAILMGCVCCYGLSLAQFNDTVHHHLSYASTGIINKTSTGSSYVITNALRFNIRKKSIALNSASNWIYGKQQLRMTNNDFLSVLDFNLYKTSTKFYYWGLANWDKSYSLKINNRLQAGLGIAYSFIDRENAFFNLSNGLLYEWSDLATNDSTRNRYQTTRNSFRVRFRIAIKERLIVDGTNFLQNSLSDRKDYIIKSNTSLSLKLMRWLSFTTSATYNKLNLNNRENLLITFGLSVEHYF